MGKTLNCNPKDGNLITENTAMITFLDRDDSIANIYWNTRRDKDDNVAEFSDLDHYSINGIRFDKNFGRSLYDTLWYTFLKKNPSIVDKIRSYDDFSDGMKNPNSINSTARVFYVVKKYGLVGLHNNCKKFITILSEKSKEAKASKKSSEEKVSESKKAEAPAPNTTPNNSQSSMTVPAPNPIVNNNVLSKEEQEKRIKRFKELDNMVIGVIKAGYNKCPKDNMIKTAKSKGYEPLDEATIIKLIEIRYDEYSKNSTPTYIQNKLIAIKQEYLNAGLNKGSENKIILE